MNTDVMKTQSNEDSIRKFRILESHGHVDRASGSRSEGLEFDSQCWPCVEVSSKLCIPHCLSPPGRSGYLVGSIVAGCRRRPLPGGIC